MFDTHTSNTRRLVRHVALSADPPEDSCILSLVLYGGPTCQSNGAHTFKISSFFCFVLCAWSHEPTNGTIVLIGQWCSQLIYCGPYYTQYYNYFFFCFCFFLDIFDPFVVHILLDDVA